MPLIEECCVLIPCNTLEDFPSRLSGPHATGLLGAWSAPWHPALIATTGKLPTWCRADTPPSPMKGLFLLIPETSRDRLPSDFPSTHAAEKEVVTVQASSRASFLEQLPLDQLAGPQQPVSGGHRPVAAEDFFALAYVFLQVQLMTRQLRYTSNLDEVHFADVVVAAAKAWQAGDGTAAAESLHSAFDMLAEERDHYFASDPHLIDLTLLAGSTLGDSLTAALADPRPFNLLLDAALSQRLANEQPETLETIRQRHQAGTLGIAGGAPDSRDCLDHQTLAQIGRSLTTAKDRFVETLGKLPDAFASYSGGIPGDLAPWIASLGYAGAIPIDFAAGTGYRDEGKLLWQAGAVELETLVSKPIDAADDAAFLRLGATLGAAVDSGDVATALLVHWPGQSCDAYDDLKLAANWGLALGKFWTLGGYFSEGERPYHSFQSESIEADGNWLTTQVQNAAVDPLTSVAASFQRQLELERDAVLTTLSDLVGGTSAPAANGEPGLALADALAAAGKSDAAASRLILNPHSIPLRVMATFSGHPPADQPHLFASHSLGDGRSAAFVDVPAMGFATVHPGNQPVKQGWFSKPERRVTGERLSNEFLDVLVGEDGSIASVHSGPIRGNRFSLQLCHFDATREPRYSTMKADRITTTRNDAAVGEITCEGRIVRLDSVVGEFVVRYRVECGSRLLHVSGEIRVAKALTLQPDPWRSYFAARAAVASEAARAKVLLRDKVHRARGRLLNAPLGIVIDEADRQTLVLAGGRPAHRVCGGRMFDTLLSVAGQTDNAFELEYGFDVKSPVSFARSRLCPPTVIEAPTRTPPMPVGWLLAIDAKNVVISDARSEIVDGKRELTLLLVETRGKTTKTRLHFFRNPSGVTRLADDHAYELEDDAAKLILAGYE